MIFYRQNICLEGVNSEQRNLYKMEVGNALLDLYSLPIEMFEKLQLETLHATEKSQVYSFILNGRRLIAKKHEVKENFLREYSGYLLFRGGRIPELHNVCMSRYILVQSFVSGTSFDKETDSFRRLVAELANLHNVAKRNLELCKSDLYVGRRLSDQIENCLDSEYLNFLRSCCSAWGEGHIPIGLDDLKEEHILVDNVNITFVDLETARLGKNELNDLIYIKDFFEDEKTFWNLWDDKLADTYMSICSINVGKDEFSSLLKQCSELMQSGSMDY